MAVSISTITKSAGWARSDVILALEEAFEIVEFHGATQTGIVTNILYQNGGTDDGSNNGQYYTDIEAVSTSGIGTGASFDIYRNSGTVSAINVNRPGYGYTNGEYLVLAASDIGASVGLGITVSIAGRGSATSFGSTTTFYVKNVGVGSEYPFGVLRHEIESNKKYGTICRAFQVWSDNQISFGVGPFFHPYSAKYDPIAINESYNDSDNGTTGHQYQFVGKRIYDAVSVYGQVIAEDYYSAWYQPSSTDAFDGDGNYGAASINQTGQCYNGNNTGSNIKFATATSPTTHDLKLRIYQSTLDPKFAIFSFTQPSVAGSKISDNTFLTFFFHNYTSSLWDYDHQWNGGLTLIRPAASSASNAGNYCEINFDTFLGGNANYDSSYSSSYYYNFGSHGGGRSALMGYGSVSGSYYDGDAEIHLTTQYRATGTNYAAMQTNWYSTPNDYNQAVWGSSSQKIYVRRSTDLKDPYTMDASTNYNAVIKGIPVCSSMVPCPYYLPDDFVLIDFRYATSETDIQQGDTITISGSEVYEVITGSYNQYVETAGILLCARKV